MSYLAKSSFMSHYNQRSNKTDLSSPCGHRLASRMPPTQISTADSAGPARAAGSTGALPGQSQALRRAWKGQATLGLCVYWRGDWCQGPCVHVQRTQGYITDGGMSWVLVVPGCSVPAILGGDVQAGSGQRNGNARQSKGRGRGCDTTLLPIPCKNRCWVCKISLAPLMRGHKVSKL